MCSAQAHVRFTPESDIKCDIMEFRFWPKADISEQAPKLSYLFFVDVLQALELADDARITFTIALHGKHAWELLVEDSHRYHSISHGWGPLTIRTTGKMPSRPLAKGERGRAFKAISPGMLPPLGIIFGLFCRVHWAVHT
jgi:hypothetical protein